MIFVHDAAQRAAAEASRDRVQKRLSRPVVTRIEDAPTFWPAEDYHQQYLEKRGLASCHLRARRLRDCGGPLGDERAACSSSDQAWQFAAAQVEMCCSAVASCVWSS